MSDDKRPPAVVPLRFWIDHVERGGELVAVEWVEWARRGGNGAATMEKVSAIRKHNPDMWSVIEPYHAAWLKGQEAPTEGTALAAWPGVTPGQAEVLKSLSIRTVEDVSVMNDAAMERVGMGARALKMLAHSFVEAKLGTAHVGAALAERDATIAAQAERMTQLEEQIALLAAKLGTDEPPRRGPGRPPKQPE